MTANEWSKVIMAVAKAVKELRDLLGWSQQRLADKAVVSQGAISRIESGNHDGLPLHSIIVVFRALSVGAAHVDMVPSPTARHLMAFAKTLDDDFTLTEPVDAELVAIIRAYHNTTPAGKAAIARLLDATVSFQEMVTG